MWHLRFFIRLLLILALLGLGTVVLASIDQFAMNDTAILSPGKTYFTVSGSVTCSPDSIVESVVIWAFQGSGPNQTQGVNETREFACTGSPQAWQVPVRAEIGQLWHPGPVTAIARVSTCVAQWEPDGWYWCESSPEHVQIDGRLQIRH